MRAKRRRNAEIKNQKGLERRKVLSHHHQTVDKRWKQTRQIDQLRPFYPEYQKVSPVMKMSNRKWENVKRRLRAKQSRNWPDDQPEAKSPRNRNNSKMTTWRQLQPEQRPVRKVLGGRASLKQKLEVRHQRNLGPTRRQPITLCSWKMELLRSLLTN